MTLVQHVAVEELAAVDREGQGLEVRLARDADERREDVGYDGLDDGLEGHADDDGDCEHDDVALQYEGLELLEHRCDVLSVEAVLARTGAGSARSGRLPAVP